MGSSRRRGCGPCFGVSFGVAVHHQLEVYLAEARGDAFCQEPEDTGCRHQNGECGQEGARERVQRERPGSQENMAPPGGGVGAGFSGRPKDLEASLHLLRAQRGDNDVSPTSVGSARRRSWPPGGGAGGALGRKVPFPCRWQRRRGGQGGPCFEPRTCPLSGTSLVPGPGSGDGAQPRARRAWCGAPAASRGPSINPLPSAGHTPPQSSSKYP